MPKNTNLKNVKINFIKLKKCNILNNLIILIFANFNLKFSEAEDNDKINSFIIFIFVLNTSISIFDSLIK